MPRRRPVPHAGGTRSGPSEPGGWIVGFFLPYGCTAQNANRVGGTWDAHWNSDANGASSTDYPRICRNPDLADAYYHSKRSAITVGPQAAACWNVGDEILLTSPDMHHTFRGTFTIKDIDESNGVVYATEPVEPWFLHASVAAVAAGGDDPNLALDLAVEAASLSRRVIFEAEDDLDDNDGLHGGHLIVYHTPIIEQFVQGVELVNFGQQGNLGRYPLHFHMSGDCSGSILSKNVVRNSNQRCIVIHGTNNVMIEDNVAFETAGHCYFTEDSAETGNTFQRNLGASIRRPSRVISGENDKHPAIFWITNPDNSWIDNVAAGSDDSGFWFETHGAVRGPSLKLLQNAGSPVPVPRDLSVRAFRNNVAHSSNHHGMRYYSPGYRPLSTQILAGSKSYRNRVAGHFVHANRLLTFLDGITADNGLGFQTFRNHDIAIQNERTIGLTHNYRDVLKATGSWWHCGSNSGHAGVITGMQIHPWKLGGTYDIRATNVEFSGFGPSTGCAAPTGAIHMSYDQAFYLRYTSANRFTNVNFADEEPIHKIRVCGAEEAGVEGIAVEDVDGTLGTTGQPGFFVTDDYTVAPMADLDDTCEPVEEGSCLLFCPNACLRTMSVATSALPRNLDMEMVVTHGDEAEAVDGGEPGYYGAAIPALSSSAVSFRDKATGEVVWPDFVQHYFEQSPACADVAGGGPGPLDLVEMIMPEPTQERCYDLIGEGDFEMVDSLGSWAPVDDVDGEGGTLEISTSDDGIFALSVTGQGADQYLDVSCLQEGQMYAFGARLRIDDAGGNAVPCASTSSCPTVRVHSQQWNPELKHTTGASSVLVATAEGLSPDADDGFIQLEGFVTVTAGMTGPNAAVFLRFYQDDSITYLLDDVTLVEISSPTAAPTEYENVPYKIFSDRTCPDGLWAPVSKDECLEAVQYLMPEDHTQDRPFLVSGFWGHVSPWCSAQAGSWDAHFNTNPDGWMGASFPIVCKNPDYIFPTAMPTVAPMAAPTVPPPTAAPTEYQNVPYKLFSDRTCPVGLWMPVSSNECLEAVQYVMPEDHTQDRPYLVAGFWGHVSPGCSAQSALLPDGSWDAHFNTNANAAFSSSYPVICKNPDYIESTAAPTDPPPTATPASKPSGDPSIKYKTTSGQCDGVGWVPVATSEECLNAVRYVMPEGHLQNRPCVIAGGWHHVPTGCSAMGAEQGVGGSWDAHWNTVVHAGTSSDFPLVCRNAAYVPVAEDLPDDVPYKLDTCGCNDGWVDVENEECVDAVQALMPEGHVQSRPCLVEGWWGHVSSGCTAQSALDPSGNWDAHWNGNTAASSTTSYPKICKNPNFNFATVEMPDVPYKTGSCGCRNGWLPVEKGECVQAVQSTMPDENVQSRTYLVEGWWGHVSAGCSAQGANHENGNWDAHWNNNANAAVSQSFPPLCKNPDYTGA